MVVIVMVIVLLIVAYFIWKGKDPLPRKDPNGDDLPQGGLPKGCYPFEEVHESGTAGEMWLGIIPRDADGNLNLRPPKGAVWVGGHVRITNTGSALDGTYRIESIYYGTEPTDSQGNPNQIGAFRVAIPGGYNFNYNATQGNGDPRDMTYFGIGHICIIDQLKY